MSFDRILFEPWSLGDAIIAAAAYRLAGKNAAFACNSRWHPILRVLLPTIAQEQLIAADLPYTAKFKTRFQGLSEVRPLNPRIEVAEILSIRGDPRDWIAARKFFPGARIRMSGSFQFFARRSASLDFVAAHVGNVRNRYHAWAELLGVSKESLYRSFQPDFTRPETGPVLIHLGAQWQSMQYPYVVELKRLIEGAGVKVTFLASPGDILPPDLSEKEVFWAVDNAMVEQLKTGRLLIANDSSGMHLAAYLGCPTLAIARISNISEWIPPYVQTINSPSMPKGYRPDRAYVSDIQTQGWPEAKRVAEVALGILKNGK